MAQQQFETLRVCLREVDRSQPYFVALLGQRYGWCDQTDDRLKKSFDKAQAEFPFVNNYRGRSVTELEILRGVFERNDEEKKKLKAFFYFRDASYLNTLEQDVRAKYEDQEPAKSLLEDLKRYSTNQSSSSSH